MMQSHVTHTSLFFCQFLEDQQMCLSDSNINVALLLTVVFQQSQRTKDLR